MTCRATSLVVYFSLLALFLGSANQRADAQNLNVNVTTWHQDIPADCTGCVYRTGQNLQESAIQNPTADVGQRRAGRAPDCDPAGDSA
jgi:hypothetical protein